MPRRRQPKTSMEARAIRLLFSDVGYDCICTIDALCKCNKLDRDVFKEAKQRDLEKKRQQADNVFGKEPKK